MDNAELSSLLTTLRAEPHESEWIEFKENNEAPDMIGQRLSALANAAALLGKERAYFVWGIEDGSHRIVGTTFSPRRAKVGNEELESWLSHHLSPCPDFRIHVLPVQETSVVLFEITPAQHTPVRWKETAYVRIGSYTKKLQDYPEKERSLWLTLSRHPFESRVALSGCSEDDILSLLDYDAYFRLTKQSLPATRIGILERLASEKMIVRKEERFDVLNLGGLLFARRLSDFSTLSRRATRVIDYSGNARISGGREHISLSGYAAGFESLIAYIKTRLPNNEHIAQALRVETEIYPEIALRELVANAIIHQDLDAQGDSPFVEMFEDRLEITNPGRPLISPLRFIDEPPQSRNETLAAFMRRVNICEERGSGIDKVIHAVEIWQLPAPEFTETERHTRIYLHAPRTFREMSTKDRTRACYQHVCLMYVFNQSATNSSLRKRFSFQDEDYKIVSKIINDTTKEGMIKPYDSENRSRRHARYIPFWA
ncbi:MAG: ATP-binding protein [Janthinobacterium lividum]